MIRAASSQRLDPDWPSADCTVQAKTLAHNPLLLQPLPRWTRIQGEAGVNAAEAGFAAGAALFALDQVLRKNPPWLGVFQMRQALAAAAVSARLLRLREDEAALRDAHHLTRRDARGGPGDGHRPGDDPGPAGRLHRAWRGLATRPARLDADLVGRLARALDVTLAPDVFDGLRAGQGTPIAVAADVAARVVAAAAPARSIEGEILALMLADVALAQKLGWRVPVPLLATAILHPPLKAGPERRRVRPSDPGWAAVCQAAYAHAAGEAHARAVDLSRRSERLFSAAGKVRTKGRAAGIDALLADDAVAATALQELGSDRAARRFLERLAALGAVRELTGRPTFRLYGL